MRQILSVIIALATTISCAQNKQDTSSDYLTKRWKAVATRMPTEWYGSEEAKLVAENVLLSQKEIGGWEKNKDYHKEFSKSELDHYVNDRSKPGATFDNGSTITELRFLAKVYSQIHDDRYKQAFEKGLNYILIAQYENGGWPQYFPVKDAAEEINLDHTQPYSMHITYNDNAMVNTMQFLKEIYTENPSFGAFEISEIKKEEAQKAFNKGIQCILNTQIIVEGNPTVWCAQHDEITLAPANARSYELASFSGSESVGIVQLLMNIENPSEAIIASVDGAILWFEKHKIEGIKLERTINEEGKRDRVVIEDKNAPPLWGRFYDLETNQPFFCSRDGIKRNSLAEISHNRRNGYSWYTVAPTRLLEEYPAWQVKSRPFTSGSQQLAFPTAEGYGKYTVGGRGGAVYEVTNLNDSGEGSLRAALEAKGPRTVVFRISGTITGNYTIKNDSITIAGQTAPGDGICIKGNLSTGADHIIIRYIRVRWDPSMGEQDGIGGRYHKNIIFDHVSASWSTDEALTLYHNVNTTVQWCIIAQACPKGTTDEHRFGGIWGNNYGTWHHNLIAHNASRNPRWASGCGFNDYRNNVIYNWEYASSYGGEARQKGDRRKPPIEHSTINMIANYYKPGPATESEVRSRITSPSSRDGDADAGKWWVSDNFVEGYPMVTANNLQGVTKTSSAYRLNEPWPAMEIDQQTAEAALQSVLDHAGCSLPIRDKVDADIIDDVLHGTAKYGNKGIIDSPSDVGGWPILKSTPSPNDADHDGMPDKWEKKNGLNPNSGDDRNKLAEDGYTMLEKYMNSIN